MTTSAVEDVRSLRRLAQAAVLVSVECRKANADFVDHYFLSHRGVTPELADSWQLGFWQDSWCRPLLEQVNGAQTAGFYEKIGLGPRLNSRLTVPLYDATREPKGLIGREAFDDGNIKWLFPEESPLLDLRSHLLGIERACLELRSIPILLVEGPYDLILTRHYKFRSVGCHRSSFTQNQALLLRALSDELILVPDEDQFRTKAGSGFVRSAIRWKGSLPTIVKLARLPHNSDPAGLLGDGHLVLFRDCIDQAKPL